MKNYSEYTIGVTDEPRYYGPACTQEDATRIADSITRMIEGEFPGINVAHGQSKITGPDSDVNNEIHEWVAENWTAAL